MEVVGVFLSTVTPAFDHINQCTNGCETIYIGDSKLNCRCLIGKTRVLLCLLLAFLISLLHSLLFQAFGLLGPAWALYLHPFGMQVNRWIFRWWTGLLVSCRVCGVCFVSLMLRSVLSSQHWTAYTTLFSFCLAVFLRVNHFVWRWC